MERRAPPIAPRAAGVLCLLITLALTACCGGGGGDDDTTPPDGGRGDGAGEGTPATEPGEPATGEPDLEPPASLEEAAARVLGPDDAFIAMDPASGEVVALVNPEVAVRSVYPPGSTFKLLTAYALLDEGRIGPHDEVDCQGSHSAAGTIYPCSLRAGHGRVDLVRALAHSCNVFFYREAGKLGIAGIRQVVEDFRLLEPTGFDPAEPRGRFPDDLSEELAFRLAAGNERGLQVTPLGMLVAFGGLVGDGQCRTPWRGERPRSGRWVGWA